MAIESCLMFRYDVDDHAMALSVVFSSHEEELQMQRAAILEVETLHLYLLLQLCCWVMVRVKSLAIQMI